MKPIALLLIPLLSLAGCDSGNKTSKSASDPAVSVKHSTDVEAVLKQLDVDHKEAHIDDLTKQREIWMEMLGLVIRGPKHEKIDKAALIDELGLGSASAVGRSIKKDGDLWLLRHYAHYPNGLPPIHDLLGDARPFTMGNLPATTDIAVEFRINTSSIPEIMRRHANHTGGIKDVESWLSKSPPWRLTPNPFEIIVADEVKPAPKKASIIGPTWEEMLSSSDMDVQWSVQFDQTDSIPILSRPCYESMKIRMNKTLVDACIPWLVEAYGEPKEMGALKGWEAPGFALFSSRTQESVVLLKDDDTFIIASNLKQWEAINGASELLKTQPAYQAATKNFPTSGNMQAYFSPMISSEARKWMESMIQKNAELHGYKKSEVKLTPDLPWSLCMVKGDTGILTLTTIPFAQNTRDKTAMNTLSGPGIAFASMRSWKSGSDRAACIMNIRNVQQAVHGHSGMRNMTIGEKINWDDIFGPDGFMTKPKCPSGGTYTYLDTVPNVGVLSCTCSHAKTEDHEPVDYSDW